MEPREKKRYIIGSIYGAVFILLAIGLVLGFWPNGNCSDNKQNQNEEGVDCGGVCGRACSPKLSDEINIKKTGLVESGLSNRYDVYAVIVNPNKEFGSSSFTYVFSLKDQAENVLTQKEGTGFILPGEEKYLVEIGLSAEVPPVKAEVAIKNILWKEFPNFERPTLRVVNKNYNEISSVSGYSEVVGVLRNESPFDFSQITIAAVLKDAKGEVTGLNSTKINTVQTGESREFKFLWPANVSREVVSLEIQPEANVFASDAFVKRYFGGQSF